MDIRDARKRFTGNRDSVESAYWEAAYAQFDAAWRAGWKAKLPKYQIEDIEKLLKPAMEASADAVERIEHAADADLRWLKEALRHDRRKWFVASIARDASVLPEALFEPMLLAGIEEPHPDFNRRFIEPCLRPFGHRRVHEYLLSVIESGSDFQKAGAVNALVWAELRVSYSWTDESAFGDLSRADADPVSLAAFEALADVRERERILLIETFVSNADLDVRRSVLGHLNLDLDAYPDSHKPLVARAIQIARTHPDEYIRKRLRCQLGETNLIPALLPRERVKAAH